jgi:hypothetical protein
MYSVFNYHNVVKHTKFYLEQLRSNTTPLVMRGVLESFRVPNIFVWRALRKLLHALQTMKSIRTIRIAENAGICPY